MSVKTLFLKLMSKICRIGKNSPGTIPRLYHSKHLAELRVYTFLIVKLIIIVIFLFWIPSLFICQDTWEKCPFLSHLFPNKNDVTHFLGLVLGLGGSILAWIYRTAAVRLGVVDLFASEIATTCRVGTVVDIATRHIDLYHQPTSLQRPQSSMGESPSGDLKAGHSSSFSSEENYFTIFSTNSKDLEALSAYTVSVVTSFYTYIKVVRDYLRRASQLSHDWNTPQNMEVWRETWQNLIYMEFLAFEAARKAITNLIEYEPSHVENAVTILLTEVKLYAFLKESYNENDMHYKRLEIRGVSYKNEAKKLSGKISEYFNKKTKQQTSSKKDEELDRDWDKVLKLWPYLRNRLAEIDISVESLPGSVDVPADT
jgi:hypothetical protein